MYTCRECERPINQATEICPYCGADLTAPAAEEATPEKKPNLLKTLAYWSVVVAAMWAFLWFILPEKKGDAAARAEATAVEAIRVTQRELADYAAAHGGGYPATLETLADQLRSVAQKAQGEGYRLDYAAGPPETTSDGGAQVRTFSLIARAGYFGYRNFFTDETGVIRATQENRAATPKDPPIEE